MYFWTICCGILLDLTQDTHFLSNGRATFRDRVLQPCYWHNHYLSISRNLYLWNTHFDFDLLKKFMLINLGIGPLHSIFYGPMIHLQLMQRTINKWWYIRWIEARLVLFVGKDLVYWNTICHVNSHEPISSIVIVK